MEGSAYTERTIALTKRVRAKSPAVGVVIQSYLYRSERDVTDLISIGCRLRLCKGAYKEPPEIAFPAKGDVEANYIKLMQLMLSSDIYHGIAPHDPRMLAATLSFIAQHKIPKDQFEFQMLYGIRTDVQKKLVRDGYSMRIYIPYGRGCRCACDTHRALVSSGRRCESRRASETRTDPLGSCVAR